MHDHRKLGRELGLFGTDPLIGAGLPYWLPAGAAVRHALEEYLRELELRAGYQHVYSPVLGKRELYEMSGHWSHYRDGMFPPMELGGDQVMLRPSLCPHHALVYRSRGRSYRELPLRLAELGGQYRVELSGVLGGLTRVRAMQLNDAHIFCSADQAAGEARAALALIRQVYAALGIEPARYRLSLPGGGGKYVGSPDMWERSAAVLAQILVMFGSAIGRAGHWMVENDRHHGNLFCCLVGRAEDVRVVQLHRPHPGQPAEHAGQLGPVLAAQLGQPQRQLAIAPPAGPVDQRVMRAQAGSQHDLLPAQLHRRVHPVAVVRPVSR